MGARIPPFFNCVQMPKGTKKIREILYPFRALYKADKWLNLIFMHMKKGVPPVYFKEIKMKPGQRKTEMIRTKAMISESIRHPTTINFLRDCSETKIGVDYSLLNNDASMEILKTYWNKNKY